VQLRADQGVEEPERVAVLDDLVLVGDNAEYRPGVLAQVRLEPVGGNDLGRVRGPDVVRPLGGLDDEHVTVRDLPPQPGLLERVVDRARVLLEHDAEPVPGHAADAEHVIVGRDAVRHGWSFL
jgi:hypothetical protein